jgi:hypothetical protein
MGIQSCSMLSSMRKWKGSMKALCESRVETDSGRDGAVVWCGVEEPTYQMSRGVRIGGQDVEGIIH